MVIFVAAWCDPSPLSSGMTQKSTHLPAKWPTVDFGSCPHLWRCPPVAPLWPIMTFQGSDYPLEVVQSPLEGISSGQAQKIAKNIPTWAKCRFTAKKRIFSHCAPKSNLNAFFIGLSRSVGRGLSLDGRKAFKNGWGGRARWDNVKNTFWKFYLVNFFSNFQNFFFGQ